MRIQILITLALVMAWMFIQSGTFDSSILLWSAHTDSLSSWRAVVHKTTNAFFMWRPSFLAQTFSSNRLALEPIVFSVLILWLSTRRERGILETLTGSIILPAFMVFSFHRDDPTLQAICFFPLLLWALDYSDRNKSLIGALPVLLSAGILAAMANQLTLLLTFLALLSQRELRPSVAISALVPGILIALSAPPPPLPAYPWDNHVVPFTDAPVLSRPLLGSAAPIAIVNRVAEKSLFLLPSVALFTASILPLIWRRLSKPQVIVTCAACALLLDARLPEKFALIAPVQTLLRIVPGQFFLPISGILLAAATTILILSVSYREQVLALALLAPAAWFSLHDLNFSSQNSRFSSRPVPVEAVSPSNYLLQTEGDFPLTRRNDIERASWSSLSRFSPKIVASAENGELPLRALTDGSLTDRWSPLKGRQDGSEWLHIELKGELLLDGIELATGDYFTDYPRAIKISCSTSCTEVNPTAKPEGYKVAYSTQKWEGALGFTRDGFPFYNRERNVKIIFPAPTRCKCILAEQTGKDSTYDWSVSEVNLALVK